MDTSAPYFFVNSWVSFRLLTLYKRTQPLSPNHTESGSESVSDAFFRTWLTCHLSRKPSWMLAVACSAPMGADDNLLVYWWPISLYGFTQQTFIKLLMFWVLCHVCESQGKPYSRRFPGIVAPWASGILNSDPCFLKDMGECKSIERRV